ncbi:MAG: nucleoside-diphosphate sugar epimerase, partial [Chloroflexi bacterium]|nr:nucleoside-diphosphate sugar epimerase [Chloroflexota bacterium]
GSQNETTIEGLARRVIELAESRSSVVFVPYDQAYEAGFEDMRRRVPSTEKLQRLTGSTPTFDLDSILEAVIAFERTQSGI